MVVCSEICNKQYVISYRSSSGNNLTITTTANTENNQLLDNLESDTFYYITVHGKNEFGDGDRTKEIAVKTEKDSDDRKFYK